MGDVPAMIDHAYLISVRELRDLCDTLTTGNFEYRVFRPNDSRVLIRFNDDPKDILGLNALCFAFPIVVDVTGLSVLHKCSEAGLMACMSVYTANQKQRSEGLPKSFPVPFLILF
jgi:hypothetical protein